MAPHAYPFLLVDRPAVGQAVFRLTAGAGLGRGEAWSPIVAIEMLAQAALALSTPADAEAAGGALLAGLEGVTFAESLATRPLAAGDTLVASVERQGALGRVLKLRGRLERDAEVVVEGSFLLAGLLAGG